MENHVNSIEICAMNKPMGIIELSNPKHLHGSDIRDYLLTFGGIGCLIYSAKMFRDAWNANERELHSSSIHIVGDAFLDIIAGPSNDLPGWGQDSIVEHAIVQRAGGSGFNIAVQLTHMEDRFSVTCDLHTRFGLRDPYGLPVYDTLFASRNLKLHISWPDPSDKTVSHEIATSVVISGNEDRSFITHRGVLSDFVCEDLNLDILYEADHIHVAGFYNMPKLRLGLVQLLQEARCKGITTSLNPQWDSSEAWDGLSNIYQLLDIFFLNSAEARRISGVDDVEQAAHFFLNSGVRLIVITLGADGAMVMRRKRREDGYQIWRYCCGPVQVIDTTGAGDAFIAGFLARWNMTGGNIRESLQWGCAYGTTLVTKFGASEVISYQEIEPYVSANLPEGPDK